MVLKMFQKRPLLIMILDGWGYSKSDEGNAFKAAKKPNIDFLIRNYPCSLLDSSGKSVGLPDGQMGNSEVGHLNIGAGRIVYQDLTLINESIKNGDFYNNNTLLEAVNHVRKKNSSLHLIGLVSDGGVHSHKNHLEALLKLAKREGIENVFIHAFLDGRDVSPTSGLNDIAELEQFCKINNVGQIASITGRYYAMDRDRRWERTKLAYDALTKGNGSYFSNNYLTLIRNCYENGITDEFIKPVVIIDDSSEPIGTVKDEDSIIFFNFRPDRARQLTYSFLKHDFKGFVRDYWPCTHFVCMTEYDKELEANVAFCVENIVNGIGETISNNGLKQLRISETEKYAHVTFFINGGNEIKYEGEDRILIPSPKVATYDFKPEMSAYEVTDELISSIVSKKYDFIILNYANMDMVGHTGNFNAAKKAVEAVDNCVGKLVNTILSVDGIALITSDHGNVEKMVSHNTDFEVHTAHTSNPVPIILVQKNVDNITLRKGKLADIAPTILDLLELEKPVEMTGWTLIK